MKRRHFLLAGAAGLAGISAPWVHTQRNRSALVIRGATLFDGTGGPPRSGDLAIDGPSITEVGSVAAAGTVEIDARGLALAPGFIDIHSHADLSLLVNGNAESRIRQGVTLEVVGQDGSSIGPWGDGVFEATRDRYQRRYQVGIDFRTVGSFLDRINVEKPAVNVASMVGHGTIRGYVMGGADRPPTPQELAHMRALVSEAMAQGAVGLSSGLEYTPGGFAQTDELIELAKELADSGYPYASHMRNEDDRLMAAVEEAIQVGRMAGVPVQISHLKAQGERNHWKAEAAMSAIESARAAGVDVHFDRYPYVAYATGLSNLFPASGRAGGTERFLERLAGGDSGAELEKAARDKIALLGSWDAVQITSLGRGANPEARGRRLGELAGELGEDPYQLTVRLLREEGGSVGMIGFGMSEENTEAMLSHPLGMVCSDGGAYAPYGALNSSTHPRAYGSFPRVLGHYVREQRIMPLEAAVHKMTGLPAQKLRLANRGRLVAGAVADMVVFDPDQVGDRATFDSPHQYPVGVPHVIVAGEVTIRDGEQTGAKAGRAVRGEAAAAG